MNSLINNNDDLEINLTRDYNYSDEDDFPNGITINRTVTINGNGYTIDANGKARIFHVTNSTVVFKNITFANGKPYYTENGGAILGASTAINCTFYNNKAYDGGAMYEGTAINSTFIDNNAKSGGGGAIYHGKAINSTFIRNIACYGGAMEERIAINCTFQENQAVQGGAGYEFNAINCNFTNNHASYLAALFLGFAINSNFKDNYIDSYGENIAVGDAVVINCTFTNNIYEDCEFCQNITINIDNYTGKSYEVNGIGVNVKTDSGKDFNNIVVSINVYKDGELVDTAMVESGEYWRFQLPEGEYIATASIEGASEIEIHNFTIKLTKDPVVIDVNDTTMIHNTISKLTATFYDAGPNPGPIANTMVIVSLDNKLMYPVTEENCSVSITLKDLSLGIHNASFLFLGDDTRERTRKDVNIFVVKIIAKINCENPFIIKYNTSYSYLIEVTEADGYPISGEQIYIDLFEGETFITSKSGTLFVDASLFQKLAAGNYTATISFGKDSGYGPSKKINIIVEKQNTSLSSNDIIAEFGSDEKIVATLTNEQGNPIIGVDLTVNISENNETFTTDENGQIKIPINKLALGEYEAQIGFAGNENYTASNNTAHITIKKANTVLSAENITAYIGSDENLTISLKDSENHPISNAKVIIVLNGVEEKTTNENGEIKVSLKDLSTKTYIAGALFLGDENYTASNITASIDIIMTNAKLTIDNSCTVAWGETAKINITLMDENENPISGLVKVYLDGFEDEGYVDYVTTDENGKGQAKFKANLNQDTINIMARFLGNDEYHAVDSSNTAQLNINETKQANVEIKANDVDYGEDTIITITAQTISGKSINLEKVMVSIDNEEAKEYDVISNIVNLGKLAAGSKLITVSPSNEDEYTFNPISLTTNVNPGTPELTVSPGEASVSIEVKDKGNPIAGTANICIDGNTENPITVTINETGTVTVPLNNLSPGNHAVEVIFTNENYTTARKTVAVNVPKIDSKDSIITIKANNITYGEKTVIEFTLKDHENKGLTADITVLFNDANQTVKVTEGIGKLEINNTLTADTYPIVANYAGNEVYNPSMATDYFKVAKLGTQIIFENMNTTAIAQSDVNTGEWFYFTLKDSNGKIMPNVPMQIGFNGVVYTYEKDGIITDENRTAKLQINLGYKGVYTFAICFLGDENYNASFAVAKITVDTQTPTLTVPNKSYKVSAKTKILTATFKTAKGTAIADK
ncbi:hypothetical protein [uncultured Methanobrevibacter sp.]|uniref:hypothetical protein n=1 Tax=uncultured Methanobrevibacter sp. TaxID=253161 RepID=UPI0025F2699D|nr:hypothetical protein [uncultured Methanobrevibacter sp.]